MGNTCLLYTSKAFETKDAIAKGADEVDMVINIGALKDKNYELVYEDIKAVVDAANKEALVKVIIETCYLTDEEKKIACELAVKAGTCLLYTSRAALVVVEPASIPKKQFPLNLLISQVFIVFLLCLFINSL